MSPQNVTVGIQDMPSQNTVLWYIGYFELKALEKQQMQGEAFSKLLFFCLKTDPPKGIQLS